jgi:hypothetical protein
MPRISTLQMAALGAEERKIFKFMAEGCRSIELTWQLSERRHLLSALKSLLSRVTEASGSTGGKVGNEMTRS